MTAVWPFDVKNSFPFPADNPLRPFRCLMFMPFRKEFDDVAAIIREAVEEVFQNYYTSFGFHVPEIKRLDWEDSSGVVHQQLWQALLAADLVFCDTTSANPNVMYELGVSAGWKQMHQVALIRRSGVADHQPFDIAPIRYFEYDLQGQGVLNFKRQIAAIATNVLIGFPDAQIESPSVQLPLRMEFGANIDDPRLYTPPFCHRRVKSGLFEFGSLPSYPHSWASIGNLRLLNVALEFEATFLKMADETPNKIGVALRSEHFYANFGHVLVLHADGTIRITEPNNSPPKFYSEQELRGPHDFDPYAIHMFALSMNESALSVSVDDFSRTFSVPEMERVNGPGLVRLHATRSWMGIKSISLSAA